jgi:chemotaxis response regulator CheB
VTLAQSEDTAFMPSMPRSAAQLGAAGEVIPLQHIAKTVVDRVEGRS